MKHLPTAQHKTLLLSAANERALMTNRWHIESWGGNGLYPAHQRKLCKRGYMVRETRQVSPTGWNSQSWLSAKGWRYVKEVTRTNKYQPVFISFDDGHTESVHAQIVGGFAVHPAPNRPSDWSVTHIPSGVAILHGQSEQEAITQAKKLGKISFGEIPLSELPGCEMCANALAIKGLVEQKVSIRRPRPDSDLLECAAEIAEFLQCAAEARP